VATVESLKAQSDLRIRALHETINSKEGAIQGITDPAIKPQPRTEARTERQLQANKEQ